MIHADVGLYKYVDFSGILTYGVEGQAGLVHFNMVPIDGRPVGADGGVLNADAGAYASASDATVGAEANLIDGSITLGTPANQIRGGLSEGLGAAGRLHYGIDPVTGYRAFGFGFNLTFGIGVEFDVKTTLPSRVGGAVVGWVEDVF